MRPSTAIRGAPPHEVPQVVGRIVGAVVTDPVARFTWPAAA